MCCLLTRRIRLSMKNGLFGDEAINTIVQEMENHREDTVIIFAGFEKWIVSSPESWLRSRIAFHLPFADYNTDELKDNGTDCRKKRHDAGARRFGQASQSLKRQQNVRFL